jgi:hypothetical protein
VTLCDLPRLDRLDDQSHADAQPRQHVDQRIGAEQVNATAQKVTYAGLRDPKYPRRF